LHGGTNYDLLRVFVKMPAIIMDLVSAGLIFSIVRRYASLSWALAAAALFAFDPAAIFISADWGQVDSVAGGVALGSLLLMLVAERRGRGVVLPIAGAWLLLAYSILIKPPAIVLVPLYLAVIFRSGDGKVRLRRALATVIGIAGAFVLAYLASYAFHPVRNPIDEFAWLAGRYAYASNVYQYNSVNAFNLYVMAFNNFWQPDNVLIPNWTIGGHTIGIPQYLWGIMLFLAAVALVVSRFVQRREPLALLEAAMILSLGYFVLSTRMHERYVFNAVLFAVPLVGYARRYLYATIILSATLLLNLFYSLDYLYVMDNHVSGVDASNLMPWLSHPAAFLNVVTFFYLGYVYLGAGEDALQNLDLGRLTARLGAHVRGWFSPLEGIAQMTRADWWIASGLSLGSFVLSYVSYVWPSEKIFDEIYYARAGEEYLSHKEIFEFTHPPLTKLVITLSMILFGGMNGAGDTSAGWRFLNLVVGALMVLVLYCFAKRLLGSTPFAVIAAGLLLFDGFHYVQSRIATPEITVAFFALLTLYAFYRFWIASQVRVAPLLPATPIVPLTIALAAVAALAVAGSTLLAWGQSAAAHVVSFLYFLCGGYAAVRLVLPRFARVPPLTSYADGSIVSARSLETPDGGRVPLGPGNLVAGESTVAGKNDLVHAGDGLRIVYARSGAMTYTTAEGAANFAPTGTMKVGAATIDGRRDGLIWFGVLTVSAGCLGASKWNGLFDFFVVWLLVGLVVVQRHTAQLRRAFGDAAARTLPAVWGNPFGFSIDVVVTGMLFIGGTIYAACYVPYFALGHDFGDLVGLQQQMFGYHYDLTATHPYGSHWWQWPFIGRPISYYYHDWRTGAALQDSGACCVAEILALPNPANWWLGLVSVPLLAWLGWRERNKGYVLLVTAYLFQWLPWIASPRVAFEYHFFPNLAIICLANAVLLQRVWRYGRRFAGRYAWPKLVVGGYLVLVFGLFVFFYPILAGLHITWSDWDARMWHPLMQNHWV
jgi:Gpi18-like mannosyltransferase